jgi:hypothetical protein
MWGKKKEKRNSFFWEKKNSLDFQKIENHVSTFPYWF